MKRERFRELLAATSDEPLPEREPARDFVESEYFDRFIDNPDDGPHWSLKFLAHHYRTFWEKRHQPNVELFHFADFRANLPGEIERLATHLHIPISSARAEELAAEASLERARSRAGDIAPEANVELWQDNAAFFRSGSAGEWRQRMTPDQQERYEQRVASLMPADLAEWVHHGNG